MSSKAKSSVRQCEQATRRDVLGAGGVLAAGATLSGMAARAYAANDETIRLALIGCGGRGTGAVGDALNVPDAGPIKLYALADLHRNKIDVSLGAIQKRFADKVDVTEDRKFLGFDAYRKAIDVLRPGDVALCTTRAYIRPTHVEYAVKKGVNVFMEKPFAPDPGGLKRLLAAGELARKSGSKIAAGLQCRHSPARMALIDKVRSGELGELLLIRADRLGGYSALGNMGDKATDLIQQLQFGRNYLFWVGAGQMVDYLIHQIDEACWLKDSWPVMAHGHGGRIPRSTDRSQCLDTYEMEYTFADGTKAFCGFRTMNHAYNTFATFVHGTKSAAQFSGNVHRATVHKFKDQRIGKEYIDWTPTEDRHSPWQYEWNDFIASIRQDREHNECQRACYSDLTAQMGRAAAHTNTIVTWDQMMKSTFQFCDYVDELDYESEAPVKPDADGYFPVPIPGKWTEV